ncbi:unnamed protein product [Pipistrellus nathusii]|uniref:Uncharacterized protein n=1 Tax=Pipistrellus nathusii TaxID=59473 RepID=A0ABN9ZTJ4_PIPNA
MFQSRKWCSLGEFGTREDAVPSSVRQFYHSHLPKTLPTTSVRSNFPVLLPAEFFLLLELPLSASWDSVSSLPRPDSSGGGMEGPHVLGQTAYSPSPANPVHLVFLLCMLEAGSLGLREVSSGP